MLYRLTLETGEAGYNTVSGFLSLENPGWQEEILPDGSYRFTLYAEREETLRDMARSLASRTDCSWQVAPYEETDWQKKWRDSIRAKKVACFSIYPPWLSAEADGYPVCIEPKNAFGTGEHETTCLCLALLAAAHEHLPLRGPFLDLGCGSGILAIACARLGYTGVAIDIDRDAVANTRENCERNGVGHAVETSCRSLQDGDRAGIVLANILSDPIRKMAPELARTVPEDGILILSGFLTLQAEGVARAFDSEGLFSSAPYTCGEWAALLVSPKKDFVLKQLPVDHFACGPHA